ncbi:hypothetical protein ACTXT7_002041 [Hymenolepis weldensis]
MEQILRDCGVPVGNWYQSKLANQLVENPSLLGGDCLEIDVKYGTRRFLPHISVTATTNEELGSHLPSIERTALMPRVK